MTLPLTLVPMVLLAACATAPSEVSVCPAPVPYSASDQARAADEIGGLAPGSVLARMMDDYGVLRAQLRECR